MKMSVENTEKLIADVIVGGVMGSFKVSGEILEIEFTAKVRTGLRDFVISTDAPVLSRVIDEENIDGALGELDVVENRRKVIPKVYELTGYEITSLSLSNFPSLEINLVGTSFVFCPRELRLGGRSYYEEWRIITSDDQGKPCWLVQVEGGELFVNQRHPLFRHK